MKVRITDVLDLQTTLDLKQTTDATLAALAALDTSVGLLEQTGEDTFAKRAIGVGSATSIPTRADGDARFAPISTVGLTDGDKGDISVSGSGSTWTIDANAVTLTKIQQISTSTFLGRTTAATGNVEQLSSTQATALLNVFGGANGTVGGVKGLVPATAATDNTRYLRGDGAWATIVPVSDGDKGDITVSASGATWTIDANAVTLTKIEQISTATFLGRTTAGTGNVEQLSTTQTTALLNVFGGANGTVGGVKGLVPATAATDNTKYLRGDGSWASVVPVSDGDKGDITVSASGATWTIDASAVTYSKIQNVSATSRFLGRKTAGSGVIEELTGTDATAYLDLFNASTKGVVAASGGGTSNYLRADGTWATPPVGGVTDGDKGDITVSAGGTTWAIDPNAVSLSKLAQVSTATFLGRNTAATGDVESLTTATVRTMLSINNVDNTSDANKPVSTATQTALNLKANIASPTFTGTVTLPADPVSALQAATKQYVDNVAQGLDTKASVRVATTANITLSGAAQTIDGVTATAGTRVLVKNQTTPAQNGIYDAAAGAWTRATDMDTWLEVPGTYVFVEEGTTQADTGWVATSDQGGTLGTTAVSWAQFSGSGTYTASGGITLTAKDFTLSNMASNTLKGNNTGGSAAPTDLTATQVKTLLALNNVDNTSDANKPVSSATLTALNAKVDDGPVTAGELTMATNRLLGRTTAATGAIEQITIGSGLTFSAGSLSLTPTAWSNPITTAGTGVSQVITLPESGLSKQQVMVFVNGIRYPTAEYTIVGTDLTVTTNSSSDTVEVIKPVGAGMAVVRQCIDIPVGDETTNITTGTAKVTRRMPYGFVLTDVRASLSTASSSGLVTVNVKEGGVSIFSTTLTINATQKTSTTATTPRVISDANLADDAEITIDIDGAGTGARGLKVYLIGYQS